MEGRLPDEVLFRIFSFLDASSLLHVAQVNKVSASASSALSEWTGLP